MLFKHQFISRIIATVSILLLCTFFIGYAQPGNGNGNGGGPDCNGPNPPPSCDCNGPNPPPFCDNQVPIEGIEFLLLGGAIIGCYSLIKGNQITLKIKEESSSQSPG